MVTSKLFELASLLGEPSHAAMLTNLMNGRFHTASELAYWSVVKLKTKFSQLDLIHNAVVNGVGEVINRIFESKYVTLFITIPKYDYLRGKVLVSDINELLDEDMKAYTLEELFQLLYEDLLKQMAYGDMLKNKQGSFDLETMAAFFMSKKEDLFIGESVTEQSWVQETPYLFKVADKTISKQNDRVEFPLKILKKITLGRQHYGLIRKERTPFSYSIRVASALNGSITTVCTARP